MLQLLYFLLQWLQPILVPLCFLLAWLFLASLTWTLWSALSDAVQRARRMHQIPCATCRFFTNDPRLKCTVQPAIANTESAIDCPDYHPSQAILL